MGSMKIVLLCSMLDQQQQRIKVIIIEAVHVAAYIIATSLFFLSPSQLWAVLCVRGVHVVSFWECKCQ